jgi:hypothetical protein
MLDHNRSSLPCERFLHRNMSRPHHSQAQQYSTLRLEWINPCSVAPQSLEIAGDEKIRDFLRGQKNRSLEE